MNKNSKLVRDWYNRNIEEYLQSGDVLLQDILDEFLTFLPQKSSILDMGSGTGRDVGYFHDHGYDVTGVDFSQEMIHHAKNNFPGNFLIGDFTETEFKASSFDGVWSSSAVLTHLDRGDTNRGLDEVVRLTKHGGVFGGVVMHSPGGMIGSISKKGFIFNRYSENELEEILTQKGMKMVLSRIFDFNDRNWIFFVASISKE